MAGSDSDNEDEPREDINDRVVFYCIAQRAPYVEVRLALRSLVSHALQNVTHLLTRVGGDSQDQYGLRVVRKSAALDRTLQQLNLRFCIVRARCRLVGCDLSGCRAN